MIVLKLKKGDKVLVIAGKDRGKRGKILINIRKKNRVIVEGINLVRRHTRPSQKNPQGGIIQKEASLDASNVQLICPNCNNPTRVGMKVSPKGKKIRVCKKCGSEID